SLYRPENLKLPLCPAKASAAEEKTPANLRPMIRAETMRLARFRAEAARAIFAVATATEAIAGVADAAGMDGAGASAVVTDAMAANCLSPNTPRTGPMSRPKKAARLNRLKR